MTLSSPPITPEDLSAFVDGETDLLANALIANHLAASPQDAALVESWQRQNELIRATFGKVEHEPIPLSLSLKPARNLRANNFIRLVSSVSQSGPGDNASPRANAGSFAKLMAAILIAFAGGMTAALLTPHVSDLLRHDADPTVEAMRGQTLSLQAMSSLQPESTPEGDADLPERTAWIALSPHDLMALGLSMTGFGTITKDADRGACLFFSKAKQPLTLCAQTTDASDDASFKTAEIGSSRAVEWVKAHKRLALAGRLPKPELLGLAQRIDARIGLANWPD